MNNLPEIRKTIDATASAAKLAAQEAVEEEREVTDRIQGVDVVLKYEGEQGRGSVTVYSGLFLNGERYGLESEHHPWSPFERISVFYRFSGPLSLETAEAMIRRAGFRNGEVEAEEECYGPGYHLVSKELEHVVRMFRTERKLQ